MTTRTRIGGFFGRAPEISLVEDAIGSLRGGDGSAAVVIVGEPGSGKSRLLAEVFTRTPDIPLVRFVGFEPEMQIPLAAGADALRALAKFGNGGDRLSVVLHGDASGTTLDPLRVFEASHAVLSRIGPAVISFDDLQWSDETSLALAHYLLRAADTVGPPVLLLCATRPGAHLAPFTQALRSVLGDDEAYVEITLGPLEMSQGIEMAKAIDPALSDDVAGELWRRGGGSPFWIERLAQSHSYPERSERAISTWLEGLGRDAALTLSVLTVGARPLRYDDLANILSWDELRVESSLAELFSRGLVKPTGTTVQISHDLIREQALRQLPEREVTRLHREFADWLETLAGDDLQLVMEALEHRIAAGSQPVTLALKAARSRKRRLIGTGGLSRLEAIADAADPGDPKVLELQVAVAAMGAELGQKEGPLNRWTALCDRLPAANERARAALHAARLAIDLGRSKEADGLLQRARDESKEDSWIQVEADALEHALRAWIEHDMASAREAMSRSISKARRLVDRAGSVASLDEGSRRAYVEALRAQRDVALTDDDVAPLVTGSEERAAATAGLGEEHLIAQAEAALALWYLNRWEDAAARLNRVLEEARAQVFPALIAELCHALAYTRYKLGRLDEALALLDEAEHLEERAVAPTRRTVSWVRGSLRNLINMSRGDWQESLRMLQQDIMEDGNPHSRLRLRSWAAMGAARFGGEGSRGLVMAELGAALTDAVDAQCARCHGELLLVSAESYLRVSATDSGRSALEEWEAGHPSAVGQAQLQLDRVKGILAVVEEHPNAPEMLRGLVASARVARIRLDELWALIDLGVALSTRDRGEAVTTWNEALDLAREIGAAAEAALIQKHLRSVGARAWARGKVLGGETLVASLSERELEVARLAASGTRNAEIAQRLFLSPKTVERHLSNVFAKLGVRNRAELSSRFAAELAQGAARATEGH